MVTATQDAKKQEEYMRKIVQQEEDARLLIEGQRLKNGLKRELVSRAVDAKVSKTREEAGAAVDDLLQQLDHDDRVRLMADHVDRVHSSKTKAYHKKIIQQEQQFRLSMELQRMGVRYAEMESEAQGREDAREIYARLVAQYGKAEAQRILTEYVKQNKQIVGPQWTSSPVPSAHTIGTGGAYFKHPAVTELGRATQVA